MSSRFPRRGGSAVRVAGTVALCLVTAATHGDAPLLPETPSAALRACADPNNLPFSNRQQQGFENRLAAILADELDAPLEYTWASEWRGFVRKTLDAGRCDVILGMPAESDRVLTTRPYYVSTYVFLSRRDRGLAIRSLDDTLLRRLRIGVHFIGDDYTNPPPAHALGRRRIVRNIVGYSLYGDHSKPNPPADLVHAVARGDIDLAIVWGPFAGYFGAREGVPMTLTPVTPAVDPPGLRFTFAIAVGVRRDDPALRARLDAALERRQPEIERLLRQYSIPLAGDSTRMAARCPGGSREAACG
jgi:mxaJ protein